MYGATDRIRIFFIFFRQDMGGRESARAVVRLVLEAQSKLSEIPPVPAESLLLPDDDIEVHSYLNAQEEPLRGCRLLPSTLAFEIGFPRLVVGEGCPYSRVKA